MQDSDTNAFSGADTGIYVRSRKKIKIDIVKKDLSLIYYLLLMVFNTPPIPAGGKKQKKTKKQKGRNPKRRT
jgi:hypothetical protein